MRVPPLHSYQEKAIEFVLANKNVVNLVDNPVDVPWVPSYQAIDMGLGKTRITIESIKEMPGQTIVLAPLRVIYNTWPQELAKWAPDLSYTILHGRHKDYNITRSCRIYLVNYHGIPWLLKKLGGRRRAGLNLVLDEISMVKDPSTQRFKQLRKLLKLFDGYRTGLSATPAPNGMHELWSQYFLLDGGVTLGKAFTPFNDKYFNYTGPPLYKRTLKEGAAKHILARITPLTIRLDADDYLKLPPYVYNVIDVEMPAKAMKAYKELEKEFASEIDGTEVLAWNTSSKAMKLRQMVQGGVYTDEGTLFLHEEKIKALKEIIESSNGQPILVPIQFKFEKALLEKHFPGAPFIVGGVKQSVADKALDRWNKGEIPILFCHPASISHGVNLQAGGHIVCWFGLTWSLEQYTQLNGRLRRQGQKNGVIVHHLCMKNTVDEGIFKGLTKKDASQKDLLLALKNYLIK